MRAIFAKIKQKRLRQLPNPHTRRYSTPRSNRHVQLGTTFGASGERTGSFMGMGGTIKRGKRSSALGWLSLAKVSCGLMYLKMGSLMVYKVKRKEAKKGEDGFIELLKTVSEITSSSDWKDVRTYCSSNDVLILTYYDRSNVVSPRTRGTMLSGQRLVVKNCSRNSSLRSSKNPILPLFHLRRSLRQITRARRKASPPVGNVHSKNGRHKFEGHRVRWRRILGDQDAHLARKRPSGSLAQS